MVTEIHQNAYHKLLGEIPLLRDLSDNLLDALCLKLEERTFTPDEIVKLNQDSEWNSDLIYLISGKIEMGLSFKQNSEALGMFY